MDFKLVIRVLIIFCNLNCIYNLSITKESLAQSINETSELRDNIHGELFELKIEKTILIENIDKLISACNLRVCHEGTRIYLSDESWINNCTISTCQDNGEILRKTDLSRVECTNACSRNPCLNGGTCHLLDHGTFRCQCKPSYYGTQCEHRVNCCLEPPKYGNCLGNNARWYYNSTNQECQTFIYSGCGGSSNTFLTMTECVNNCERGACCTKSKTTQVITCVKQSKSTCKSSTNTEVIAFHVGWPVRNSWRTDYASCDIGIRYPIGDNFTVGCDSTGNECTCLIGGITSCWQRPNYTRRLEFLDLNYHQWKNFAKVIKIMRLSGPGNLWEHLTEIFTSHYLHATSDRNYLLWNRMYLKYVELLMQQVNCNVTLPFWDFTIEDSVQNSLIWSSNKMGRPIGYCVKRHAFQNGSIDWEPCISRQFRTNNAQPTKYDVMVALSRDSFEKFTVDVKNIVKKLCKVLGLDGTTELGSPYDPVFYLIQGYVDMLFAKWQERHNDCSFESTQLETELLYPFKDSNEDIWGFRANYQTPEWYNVIDPCVPNPCFHGATCKSLNETKYYCECSADFEGHLCEVKASSMRCYQPRDNTKGCGATERWYYDTKKLNCYQYNYTGCKPKGNTFVSHYDCKIHCLIGACCWRVPLNPSRVDGYDSRGYDKYGRHQNTSAKINWTNQRFRYVTSTSKSLDCQGYDERGFNYITGFNLTGYNAIGDHDGVIDYDANGFNKDGYDRDGFNCQGVNSKGYDRCGFTAGYHKECRSMSMSDCKNVEKIYPYLKRKVVQFALGKRCEDIECANTCTCNYLSRTYNLGESFAIGSTKCECQRGGSIKCDFEDTKRKEIRDFRRVEWDEYHDALRQFNIGDWPTKWMELTQTYSQFLGQSQGVNFLTWHRFWLKMVESELRNYRPNITIPYYDWTIDNDVTQSLLWQANVMGGNGDGKNDQCVKYVPFENESNQTQTCLRRNLTSITLPSKVHLELTLRTKNYTEFVLKMQRISGQLHRLVDGHMMTIYCFYDPVFLQFYAFLDKLFSDWEIKYSDELNYHLKYTPMEPFGVTPDDVMKNRLKVKYLNTLECACKDNYQLPSPKTISINNHEHGYVNGFDQMNWDFDGFNKDGFNRDGYDREGYNRNGFNRYGIHKNNCVKVTKCAKHDINYEERIFDQFGFDSQGLDVEGYDQYGFDLEGLDRRDCSYGSNGPFYNRRMVEYETVIKELPTEKLLQIEPYEFGSNNIDNWYMDQMWWVNMTDLTNQGTDTKTDIVPEVDVLKEVDYWIPIRYQEEPPIHYCSHELCHNKTCPFNPNVHCKVKYVTSTCSMTFIDRLTGEEIPCPEKYCEYKGKYYLNGTVLVNKYDANTTCQRCFCHEGKMTCWNKEKCVKTCTHGFDSNTSCCSMCSDCSYHDYLLVNGQLFSTPNNPCNLCTCKDGNVTCVNLKSTCPKLSCKKVERLKEECCPSCKGCLDHKGKYLQHGSKFPSPEDKCKTCNCIEGDIKCSKNTCVSKCRNPITFDCCADCSGCYYKGVNYTNGATFDDGLCRNCSCNNGNVDCQDVICPVLNCPKGTPVPGQCCPICQDCEYKGIQSSDQHEFITQEDPCVKCKCDKGNILCKSIECGNQCSHPVKIPGQCCPYCDRGCQLGSKLYQDHETFAPILEDPCFTCNCSSGNIDCHNVTCPETNCLTSVKVLGKCCPICTCEVGDTIYREGQKWNSTQYKCEECVCLNSRPYCYRLECPLANCSNSAAPYGVCCPECNHCEFKRRLYRNGQHFIVNDGTCRKCQCENGEVTCQVETCPPVYCTHSVQNRDQCCPSCDQGCLLEGKLLKHAEKFQHPLEKCVDCKCNGGNVTCTQRKCQETKCLHPAVENCCPECNHCEYQGELVKNGDKVLFYDECTICTCEDGTVVCRAKKCPPYNCQSPILRNCCPICVEGCFHNGNTYALGEEFETPDKPCEKCICIEEKVKPVKNPKGQKDQDNSISNWIDFQEGRVHCYKKPCGPVQCKNPKPGVCCPVCTGTCLLGSAEMQNGTAIYDPDNPCNYCKCLDGKLDCVMEVCPQIACAVSIRKPGECCETCKGCMYEGREYNSGSSWTSLKDPCISCQCDGGIVSCAQLQCVVPCVNPVPVPGQCCPMCPGCTVGSKLYKSGETFNPNHNPCEICTCESGQLLCLSQHCPPLIGCPKESIKPAGIGECCPTCSGLSTACHENDIDNLKHPTNDPCFTCECKDSTWICIRQICPRWDNCPEEYLLREPGECCATCSVCVSEIDKEIHANNSRWTQKDDPCLKCACQNGNINCTKEICPQHNCLENQNLIRQSAECCGQCVNLTDLSCIYSDEIYKNGEIWKLDTCTECTCSNQVVRCHTERCPPLRCPDGYTPTIDPGLCCPKCILKPATCAAFGDPHYRTFDGQIIHFQGTCRYVLAKDCDSGNFTVEVQNSDRGKKVVSWTESVHVEIGGVNIDLYKGPTIMVNDEPVIVPYLQESHFYIEPAGTSVLLSTNVGVQVIWDGESFVEVSVSGNYGNKVCGLCGNFNSFPQDDLRLPGGQIATSETYFGDSWKTPGLQLDSCQKTEEVDPCSRGGYKAVKLANIKCSVLKGAAFRPCHKVFSPEPYYASCVYDLCACWETFDCLCDILETYSRKCSQVGVILSWRKPGLCDIGCPKELGLIFDECGPPCPRTCENKDVPLGVLDAQCFKPCISGCQCPADKVLHRGKCIKPEQCPNI